MDKREIYDEWRALAGMRCICRIGCTDVEWGDGRYDDGSRICDPNCEPCRIMVGREYHDPPK